MNHEFPESFAALTEESGRRLKPFRWQQRLYEKLLRGEMPGAVDIPTGLGKTAVMALWLIALANGAKLPRRLVYIVDRRAVVDQATRFAEQLRRNLSSDLAASLGLRHGDERLPISTLRGGLADNRDWLEDPSKPAVIVGTIDMIGSRLLFEGYGVSRRMRPYHAGLLGVDALFLLDEAHLCPPFEAMLRKIEKERDGALGAESGFDADLPPFRLMALSATGREMVEPTDLATFRLVQEDREELIVQQRINAAKQLGVHEIENDKLLSEHLVRRALELGCHGTACRILVFCNSRKTAVQVKKEIDKRCRQLKRQGALEREHSSELLVGERRVYERTQLEGWLESNGFINGNEQPPEVPTFLIATSAGEVGVDMDADHMVCDLVSYERMVQRLGRVNRRGGEGRSASVEVFAFPRKDDNSSHKKYLAPLSLLPLSQDDSRDASPEALSNLKRDYPKAVEDATTSDPLYPELIRPLVDAWAMTSLTQHTGRPEIGPWLRGWEKDAEPQTIVVWRRYLPSESCGGDSDLKPSMAADYFRCAPPHSTEQIEAVSSRVLEWLLKSAARVAKLDKSDASAVQGQDIVAVLLDRSGAFLESLKMADLEFLCAPAKNLSKSAQRRRDSRKKDLRERNLPGAMLILDARIGGLRDGMLDETAKAEATVADSDPTWREMKQDVDGDRSAPLLGYRVLPVVRDEDGEGLRLPEQPREWRHIRTFETELDGSGVALRGLAVFKHSAFVTDEDGRSVTSMPQSLSDHLAQVAAKARALALAMNLPTDQVDAIELAARLHDVGKDTPRWQNAMNAPKDGCPYAKTCGGGNWRLLEGYRHEFGSLIRAEEEDLPEHIRDLVLHLIASHHGNARPIIRSDGCDDGPPSMLERKAGEAAVRFARLHKRYGPWGLAWREAILRAADQIVSRQLSNATEEKGNG